VSKVAKSAVCGMFEAASFNPAHTSLKSCTLCPLDHETCTAAHSCFAHLRFIQISSMFSVILTPPNLHFFVAICQFYVIDARVIFIFPICCMQCHFDPTKSALFCGNLAIFCHRCIRKTSGQRPEKSLQICRPKADYKACNICENTEVI
jgi:hypothetical protein